MHLAIATQGCNQKCRRQWCKCTPKMFDLLKIWAKSLKIREKSLKIWQNTGKIPEN